MYRKQHNGQLSVKDFHVPFWGTLDPDNRWVLLRADSKSVPVALA